MSEKVDQPDSQVQESKEVVPEPVVPDVKLGEDFIPRSRLNQELERRKALEAQTAQMQAEIAQLKAQGSQSATTATADEESQWFDQHLKRATGGELGDIKAELAETKALLQQQAAVVQKTQFREQVDAYITEQEATGIEYTSDVKSVMRQLANSVVGTPAAAQITLEDLERQAVGYVTVEQRKQRQNIAQQQAGEPRIDPADLTVQTRSAPSLTQTTQADDPFAAAREVAKSGADWETTKQAILNSVGNVDIGPFKD
jgi:hypothetical protein